MFVMKKKLHSHRCTARSILLLRSCLQSLYEFTTLTIKRRRAARIKSAYTITRATQTGTNTIKCTRA